MKIYVPGLPEKIALGCDLVVELTHEDLTETTVNTAQTFTIKNAPAGTRVGRCAWYLAESFEDQSDAAFNTTTMTVGDSGDADRFLTSTESNENGTEVDHKVFGVAADYIYTAATDIIITVNAMAAKALNDIDKGRVLIGLELKETVGMKGV